MSVNEILDALDTLSPSELDAVVDKIDAMRADISPEELEALEIGLRSSREERSYTIEEVREEMRKWRIDSK